MNAQFWERIALAILVIVGVWTAFGRGMIFGWLGDAWEKRLPAVLGKPLFSCPPCMSSTYGTAVWMLTGGTIDWWIPFVLALCGAMKIVTSRLLC